MYALKTVYCSLVRSILECAVQIWAPFHETQIGRIERVQRCFVRYALRRLPWSNPLQLPPYNERCQLIRLESLRKRRVYLQLMFAFDLLSNRIDYPELLQQARFFVPARRTRSSRPEMSISSVQEREIENTPLTLCISTGARLLYVDPPLRFGCAQAWWVEINLLAP